jgi:Domain of unknown function (DUF4442)
MLKKRDLKMFDKFINKVQTLFYLQFFLLIKLPSAYFSGVRLKHIDEDKCFITVPYKWFSRNPFRSTYFACLAMAAEMSTGMLAMGHCYKKSPEVSMLVRRIEANFTKKATGRVTFTCEDGRRIENAINDAILSGKGTTVNAYAYGKDKNGDSVADFIITWSFKSKIA